MSDEQVLISAHRFGTGADRRTENSLPALERAIALGVDFAEFDVRRRADGRLVVAHDEEQIDDGAPEYAAVLDLVAGRVRAHIDLKLTPRNGTYDDSLAAEIGAVRLAVDRLGPTGFLVTLGNPEAVRALRRWADAEGLDLVVGLSLGHWTEVLPRRRLRRSRANLVVAHWALARLGVARLARRRGLPLLVWTVDRPGELRHWLRPGRAFLVTTNHPGRALGIRGD